MNSGRLSGIASFLGRPGHRQIGRQFAPGLQKTLQARYHHRPAAGDAPEGFAALVELVVRHSQLDDLAARLDVEGDARGALAARALLHHVPAIGELSRWIRDEHLAFDGALAVLGEMKRRSRLPVRRGAVAEPVAFGEVAVGQRMPQFLGRRLDIGGVDEFRLAHRTPPTAIFALVTSPSYQGAYSTLPHSM